MKQQNEKRYSAARVLGHFLLGLLTLLIVFGSSLLFNSSSSAASRHLPALQVKPVVTVSPVVQETTPWENDTQTTAPTFDFSQDGSVLPDSSISPLFEGYYTLHSGATSLGAPLTTAFHTDYGWIQFFASGALLLRAVPQKHFPHVDDPLAPAGWTALINAGVPDPTSGIVRLPLFQALLSVGSLVPVVEGSSLTYADLRAATAFSSMIVAPEERPLVTLQARTPEIFVPEGTRSGKAVGHLVPLPIWNYIHQADVSPDGWGADFGAPLSEALPLSVTLNGSVHYLLVQAFSDDAVVLDLSSLDVTGQPQVSRLETGSAYLRTVGPPAVMPTAGQQAWSLGDTVLLESPGAGQQVAHIGLNFPLVLLGDASWDSGALWYRVHWTTPGGSYDGWVEASAITFTSPGSAPAWASIDALSPGLAAYLAGEAGNIGVAIYDLTHQRYYVSNADSQFITGSSIKVPIMLTLLDLTESQGREPDSNEMALLTTMIENSNNDSAAALFNGEVGGAAGVASYLQSIGINGMDIEPDSFGWSLITPLTMVSLLTKLYEGTILTPTDRALALSLMEQIEPDQQVGVGDTAPAGATVAMKDGWVVGPDGLWNMNSSGIVTLGSETYIIAVYSQGQNTLDDGHAIVQYVCGAVAALLLRSP